MAHSTIIAVTSEDDRFDRNRRAAIRQALDEHASLILYDLDAGSDPLESPLPTEWSSEGTEDAVTDRLGPEELEAAGRAEVARQVREARDAGVDAWGWLPESDDPKVLRDYAEEQPEALVLDPRTEAVSGT
jgi:hypothetical protein